MASLVGRLVLAWWVDGPFMFQDEGGYLGVARLLAGEAPALYGPTYHPLWGVLLAPAAAVFGPGGEQNAAQLLNALAAAATIPVLHLVGRRACELPPWTAAVAAIAGGLTAASLVQAPMLLPEALLTLLVALAVLLVHHLLQHPTAGGALAVGSATGAAYGAHPRAAVLLLALAVVALLAWRRGLLDRRHLAALGGSALGTSAAVQVLHLWATDRLYPAGTQPSLAGSPVGALAEPLGSAVIALGQLWYLVVASVGVAAVGAVGAGRLAWADPRSARGLTATFVVLGALASLALGTSGSYDVGVADDLTRADLPVYGRYVEQWLPVLLVWAPTLATAWRRRAAPVAAVGLVATALALRAHYPPATWELPVAWHNVATLRLPVDTFGDDHVVATALAAGALAVLLVLPRRPADLRWAVPLGTVLAVNLVAGVTLVRDWAGPSAARWHERDAVAPALVAAAEEVWVDLDDHHDVSWAYHAQFLHPDLAVRYFEGTPPPAARHLLGRAGEPPAPGATPLAAEPHGDYVLWGRPPG